jgi:hypothetical protein
MRGTACCGWTADDVAVLRKHWDRRRVTSIARTLGRTKHAVWPKAARLGLGLEPAPQRRNEEPTASVKHGRSWP